MTDLVTRAKTPSFVYQSVEDIVVYVLTKCYWSNCRSDGVTVSEVPQLVNNHQLSECGKAREEDFSAFLFYFLFLWYIFTKVCKAILPIMVLIVPMKPRSSVLFVYNFHIATSEYCVWILITFLFLFYNLIFLCFLLSSKREKQINIYLKFCDTAPRNFLA